MQTKSLLHVTLLALAVLLGTTIQLASADIRPENSQATPSTSEVFVEQNHHKVSDNSGQGLGQNRDCASGIRYLEAKIELLEAQIAALKHKMDRTCFPFKNVRVVHTSDTPCHRNQAGVSLL